VTHPRFAPEVRQIQVIAGQTTQVQFRLAPRSGSALSTLNEGLDSLRKKVFRSVRTR
jgi:hypothetical protein